MAHLTDKQLRLLGALQLNQRRSTSFTAEDLAEATGYDESSIKTYISKKLRGHLVFDTDVPGRYRAHHAIGFGTARFAELMTQCDRGRDDQLAALDSTEWQQQVEDLLELGRRCGYDVNAVLERAIDQLAA